MAVRVVQSVSIDDQVWLFLITVLPLRWVVWAHFMLGSSSRL